jgi:hypothetical protein
MSLTLRAVAKALQVTYKGELKTIPGMLYKCRSSSPSAKILL